MRAMSKFSVFRREPRWKILIPATFSFPRKYRHISHLQFCSRFNIPSLSLSFLDNNPLAQGH
jgi:hypothetical protein